MLAAILMRNMYGLGSTLIHINPGAVPRHTYLLCSGSCQHISQDFLTGDQGRAAANWDLLVGISSATLHVVQKAAVPDNVLIDTIKTCGWKKRDNFHHSALSYS